MAQRKSNFDLEAQRPITSHKVDKPNDTWCLIGGILVLIGLCAGSIYMIKQISGGGAGVTELCNSYTKRQGGKPSKFELILGKVARAGYTSHERVVRETMPFLETFVRHFQNNVNALGSFHNATMKFDCQVDGLKFNDSVFIEGGTADEFLEALATKSQVLDAKYVRMILRSQADSAFTLLQCLQALHAASAGLMAELQQAQQGEQPIIPAVEKFKKMNPFEQKEYLNSLIDKDYYGGVFNSAQAAAQIKQVWSLMWAGHGHAMEARADILQALMSPRPETAEGQKAQAGGLIVEAAMALKAKSQAPQKAEVPLIAWIKPDSTTLEVSRGLIPQSTMVWQNGPVNGAQPVKATAGDE